MRCKTALSLLGSRLDGELTLVQRSRVQLHLGVCRDCRAYWQGYRQTVALAKQAYSAPARECHPAEAHPKRRSSDA